jgi:uncharacterized membrane protein YbhN (UPF0104 family)
LVLTKAIDAVVLAALIALVFGGSLVAEAQLLPIVALGFLVAIALGLAQRYRINRLRDGAALTHVLNDATRYARELSPGTIAIVLATTAFAWVVGGLANVAVLAAVGAPAGVDPAARILVSGYVAGLLPAPPGRLGVFEGAVAAALVSGGFELTQAIAAAVLLHALQLVELGLLAVPATRWR